MPFEWTTLSNISTKLTALLHNNTHTQQQWAITIATIRGQIVATKGFIKQLEHM